MTSIQLAALDFDIVPDKYPDRWERADPNNASISMTDTGEWSVQLDDGDQHDLVLARRGNEFVGWCDCDGFAFHTKGRGAENGPCAHLCVVRKMATINESMVPDADALEDDVDANPDQDDVDVEVVEQTDAGDDDPEDDVDDQDADQEKTVQVPSRDVSEIETAEANLDELASTRATNRALRLATGCGLASIEELETGEGVKVDG